MISARRFYRRISIWSRLTPTIEDVVRWLNENLIQTFPGVPAIGGEPANNALIAEVAFGQCASGIGSARPSEEDVAAILRYLKAVAHDTPDDVHLEPDEYREIGLLAAALSRMLEPLGSVEYWPQFPGCGVVDSARGDISVGSALYEVKSVSRPFRAPDVRQLFTYCALAYAAGRKFEYLGLINPRRGNSVRASVEFLSLGASGQAFPVLMRNVIEEMGGEDSPDIDV